MSHPIQTAEDWIPRDDMAQLIRSSVDTVKREAKKHDLTTRTDGAGRVLVNVEDFLRIGRLRPEDLTVGGTPAESAAMLRMRETVTALSAQVAELTGRLSQSDLVIDTLRDQITVKDKQLNQQANQLTQLIGRLGTFGGAA